MKRAVLLVNLGSPDSPDAPAVRRYLRQFLMDRRVIDIPTPLRFLLVNAVIAPFRARHSARAYRAIWTPEGSPLVAISRRVQAAVQAQSPLPVALAMRYGVPGIPEAIAGLTREAVESLRLIPLYPHYAMSSFETVVESVRRHLARQPSPVRMEVHPPFYSDPDYLDAMTDNALPHLAAPWDHCLFSYHGLPERHLRRSDPTGRHCLNRPDCCEIDSPARPTCYRAQVRFTSRVLAQRLGLDADRWSEAYQSRLGRDAWLMPNTAAAILRLAVQGVKRLVVLCPSFVSDCLETLEEIGIRGRATFLQAGGEELRLVPCLNTHPRWIETLARWARA